MRAARFWGRRDLRVEHVAAPVVAQDDDVVVRVGLCGICGTDLHEYLAGPILVPTTPHGLTGDTLPVTMGHEFGGVVEAVGPAVREVRAGDRVCVQPIVVCGRCADCRSGHGHLCRLFGTTGIHSATGGLAELARVKDYQVARIPEDLTDEQAAVVEPASVAVSAVDRAGLRGGDVVLVCGAGPIGVLTAMYALARGATEVILAEPNPRRAARAAGVLDCQVLDPASPDFAARTAELTRGRGVDLAVECSGTSAALATAIEVSAGGATVVQVGLHTRPATVDLASVTVKSLTLRGSFLYDLQAWPRVIGLVASGRFPIERVVTSVIGLDDVVQRGFDALVDPAGDQLKILARPGPPLG